MTAEAETRAYAASEAASRARAKRDEWTEMARRATVKFIDAGLEAGWPWDKIGSELGMTGTAARGYYKRNRRLVRGVART